MSGSFADTIQALVNMGDGFTAEFTGQLHTWYRPNGSDSPVRPACYMDALPVFITTDPGQPQAHRAAARQAAGIRPVRPDGDAAGGLPGGRGDVLRGVAAFAAATLLVGCNAVVDVVRSGGKASLAEGANGYVHDMAASESAILTGWPCSITLKSRGETGRIDLPGDVKLGTFEVHLPACAPMIRTSDVLTDANGPAVRRGRRRTVRHGLEVAGAVGERVMADQSDVLAAIEQAVAAALLGQAPLVSVIRGWPEAIMFDTVKAGARVLVAITYREGMTRNATRYLPHDVEAAPVPPGLTVEMSGSQVTFGGAPALGDVAGIAVGGTGYAYRCIAQDTPASVALTFQAMVGGIAAGSMLTLSAPPAAARVVHDGQTAREVLRIEEGFTVTVWTRDPVHARPGVRHAHRPAGRPTVAEPA